MGGSDGRYRYRYDCGQNGPNLDGGVPVPEKTWLGRKIPVPEKNTGTWKIPVPEKYRYRYLKNLVGPKKVPVPEKTLGKREADILAEPCPEHRYPSITEVLLLQGVTSFQNVVYSWDYAGIWLSFIEGTKRRNTEQFWNLQGYFRPIVPNVSDEIETF